jgi:hypothetical protein
VVGGDRPVSIVAKSKSSQLNLEQQVAKTHLNSC